MIKSYVISLASETTRRQHILDECSKFNITPEIIEAVDMRQATQSQIEELSAKLTHLKPKKQRWLSKGELGCALSHHNAYKRIIQNQDAFALILEDDAQFVTNPHILLQPENLEQIYQQYPFDILCIGYVKTLPQYLPYLYRRTPIKFRIQIQNIHLGTLWKQFSYGTVAYIITKQGAEKLAAATQKPCATADDWLYFEQKLGIKILHSRPTFVLEALESLDSTIRHDNYQNYHPKLSSKIIRSIKGDFKNILMNHLNLKK